MIIKAQTKIFYLFIAHFLKDLLPKELLVSAEFQKPEITPADVVGWSINIIRTCEQKNIVEYTGQIFGVFSQDIKNNKKTYEKLPPHWSALVRLDLMLYGSVDEDEGDFAGIIIDSGPMDRYTKSDSDGYKICSDSKGFFGKLFNDAIYPYQKNVTHTSSQLTININSYFTGKNTVADYEGYAFKHVSVYIDTCYESCQSCNGPTPNQCITCISKAVQVNGICTCQDKLFAYKFECISDCPYGFVGNPNTKICEQSKCLNNCGNCLNQQCTQCNYPNKLISGECVTQCPSYSIDKGTYCEDKISGLDYGGYVFKGLYSSNFGDSDIQGQGLKLVNFKNGGATFSSCSGERFIGGWNIAGAGSEIRRELVNFKPHWSIRIGFKYIMIDNWDSKEFLQVALDKSDNIVSNITQNSATQVGNICGNGYEETKGVYDYNTTHISSSLIIIIKSNLDPTKSPFEASFGIRELFILINYCQDNCQQCNQKGCSKCQQGYFLYQYNCQTSCPTDLGFWPNPLTNTCDLCQGNCLTCETSATSCLKCKPGTYLSNKSCSNTCPDGFAPNQATLTCDKCHQNCKTCKIPNDDSKCNSCQGSRFLSGTSCLEICPDGLYGEYNGNNCAPCNINCLTCKGKTNADCLSCKKNSLYQPDDNTCGDKCKANQYINGNNCTPCDQTCKTCSGGTSKDCNDCSSGSNRYFFENQCLSQCPDQYYPDKASQAYTDGVCKSSCPVGKWTNQTKQSCELCDLNCKACDTASKSNCTSCVSPLFLDKNSKKCVETCPSKYFGNKTNLQCDNCEITCQECTGENSNQCTKCSGSIFLDTNKCVSTCQPGKFSNQSTNNCDLCDKTQCKECVDSSTNCTKCDTNLYLNSDNTCLTSCPKGFYGNSSNGKCDPCSYKCKTCFGPNDNQCTNCTGDLFFDPILKQCESNCQQKYYANKNNNQCMECDKSCLECTGSKKNQCKSCPDTFILFNNECISNCPDQYFKDPNAYNCIKCDSSCFNCIDSSPSCCNACRENLFLTPSNYCLEDCPDGTFKDIQNNICQKCDSSCLTCSGPDKNYCTKCPKDTYLEDNLCKQECTNGWKNQSNNTCDACHKLCQKCNGPDQNNCLECPAGAFYNSLDNTCGTNCPSNYYANASNNKCDKCNDTCKNCTDSGSDKCSECEGLLFLKDGKQCSSSCNDNEYGNILSNKCELCDKKCKTCKDKADKCTSCNIGTFLIDGSCQSNCPDSTFKNNKLNICENCNSSCLTCSGSSIFECNSCKAGTYLDKSKNNCVTQCPSKYFRDSTSNTCLECIENCDVCSDFKTCSKCLGGFFLFYGQCLDQCPTQYFNDKNTQQCSSCSKNCQTCFDSTSNGCFTCISGTFKNSDNNSCLYETECPSGKYPDLNTEKCESCFSTCTECDGKDENQCKQCIEGRLFYKGECLKECPSNTFKLDNKCVDCHLSCSTCYGSSEQKCLTCSSGILQEGSCVDYCIQNYYEAIKNGQKVCLSCNDQCSKCNGPDSNNCTECSSKLFMYQSKCVEKCPIFHIYDEKRECQLCTKSIKNNKCVDECGQNEYLDQKTKLCQSCATQCQRCYGPTTSECKQCSDGYFLDVQKNECKKNCPEKYFPDKQKNLCEMCDPKCNACSNQGDSNCLSCNSPLVLFEGKCLKDDPDGYYKDKEDFKKCKEDCKTCDGPSSNDCLSCLEHQFILNKKCYKKCPPTFFNNESLMQCTKCTGICKECQSLDYCLSCHNNQYAFQGICLDSCEPVLTFQDENQKQCIQCHSNCNANGCFGPEQDDCINVGVSGLDLLIVKILIFKTVLWIFSSIIGIILDYKNSKSIGKFGQIRPSNKQLSIHVSDKQVRDIIRREKQDMDFQGTQLNVNTSRNRVKRNLKVRTSMISMLPSALEQTDAKQSAHGEFLEAESPTKKSIMNFSSVNIQSQLQMLPYQHSSNDINNSPTARNPDKNGINNENNLTDFKITPRPIIKQPTLPKINEAIPTFQNMEEQASSDKNFQNEQSKDASSVSQVDEKSQNIFSYPRKLYYTIIGNEIISILTLYDPQKSRLFRSSMLYLKYLALFFMTYASSKTNYGVAVVALLVAITFKVIIQHILSQIGVCLRKAGLLSLVFVMIITGTDIGFWFVPKVQKMKELLISEEFQKPQITPKDVNGWSKYIIRTCEQKNIVEYTGQIFGVFSQDVSLNKKTYKKLPPHWSALVRLDLMLYGSVDADEGDYAGISIDDNPMDRYTKNDQDGYLICSNSKAFNLFGLGGRPFYDAIYPYQKNVTHTDNSLTIKIDSKFTGRNTEEDYEGYAFKHVSVYVDTCYDSCQSCFGPSSNQCTACIALANKVNGVCTCSGKLFAYQFKCIKKCPDGFVGNPDTKICEESKCKNNCGNCENFSCTSCNFPNKLMNDECVAQCPSFSIDKGTYCEDKIKGLTYGGYVFKGLYSSNFGDSEIQGQGLRLINFKNGGATFSSCAGERYVGGWNVAGQGSEIRRELPKLYFNLFYQIQQISYQNKSKPHWSIRIGFKYIMIDNWDKSEFLFVTLDNNNIISTINKGQATDQNNICGNKNREAKGIYDFNITHISSSLTITIKSNLTSKKSPFEASFGVRELFILVNYCQDNCLECNEKGCTKCTQGTYLYEYNCETSCPTDLGFWANGKSNACEKCEGNCLTCDISATSCLKCKPGSYLYQKSYSQKCPDGYAPILTALTCDKCNQNCKTCTNPSNLHKVFKQGEFIKNLIQLLDDDQKCTSCEGQRFLSDTQCIEQCPDGTYGEYNGNKCQLCNINCLTCKGKTNSDCLSCNANKYYQPDDNTCGDNCKINQYINRNNCTPCHETCHDCIGGTEKDCKSCSKASNRFLHEKQCLSSCPDQFYPDKVSQTCKKCDSTCFNCTGPNQNKCTQCSGDLYLNPENKCLDTCPDGQFKNQTNNKCESCDSNCVTCITTKNNCTKQQKQIIFLKKQLFFCYNIRCNAKIFLDSDGVCKNSCPEGKWINSCNDKKTSYFLFIFFKQKATRQCELCDPNCQTCDHTSKSNCASCSSPLFLDINSKKCVNPCPQKFFGNQSTQSCDKCEISCQECDGPNSNQCTKCSNDLYLDVNKCVDICSPGKFSNKSTKNCDLCDQKKCKECVGSCTNCTKCNSNLYLFENTCQAVCPQGYYPNPSNGKCDSCNHSCETCFGPNADQCTNCKGDLFFDPVSQKCVEKCQQKYYANKENNQCVECGSSCLECSGSLNNECTKCPDKLILFNNECISNCPGQYFKDPNAYYCIQCDSSCFNCLDDSPNSCTACQGNLFLTPTQQCLKDCPDGTHKDASDNICKKCDISCLTCSGPDRTNCLKCSGDTYLEKNQCKKECNEGWKNSTKNICDQCNIKCLKCNGPDENNCLECPNGAFLNPFENTCVTECPTNYYPSSSNNKCLKCDTLCKNCTDIGSDKCTQCEGSLFLKDGNTCSSNCNNNEYGNILNNKCELCDKKCKTCIKKADKCTSCYPGTFLAEGKCESECPDSTFKNEKLNICDSCNTQCQTCFGPSNFECNSCIEGTYLDKAKNNCVPECPIKYFGDSTSNKCRECIDKCDECSDDKTCKKCSGGYFLHKGQCVNQCPTKFFNDTSSQQCIKCAYTCLTCFDATDNGCLTCITETFKNTDNNSCLYENECPSGRYPDRNTKKCESCFSTCEECEGKNENQCVKCNQNRLLYQRECLKECPSNTFKFENKCIDCDPSCATCFGTSSFKCLACSSGLKFSFNSIINNYNLNILGFLLEGSCVEQCESNYYPSTKNGQQVCLQCHAQCSKCNGPDSNNCTECPSEQFMYQNQCIKNCPVFHIYDEKRVCQQCTRSIKNNKCVQECDQNEYLDKKTLLCQPCAAECHTCNGPTKNECKQCADSYFLDAKKNECTQKCPDQFFPNKDKRLCEACDSQCNTCSKSGDPNCLSCNSPLILFEGKCLKDAPNGYYKDKYEFKKCNEDCKTCDGSSSNDCLSCHEHHFILDKKCYKQCPSTYFNDESSMECTKCTGLCKECQSADYCISCIDNQYVYNGTCLVSCDPTITFQDELLKQCVQCHLSCNKNGCLGPEQGDCINEGSSGFDSLITKILILKSALWIISSVTGTYLDYKNAKFFGKFGQVRSSQKQLSIYVSDKQVRDIIRRERKDMDFQGSQLNQNTCPNRRKRTAITRVSMISMIPTAFDQASLKQNTYKDILEAESPTKKSTTNFSSVNIQSQIQILPFQNAQNDINPSPTSRSPYKINSSKINFGDFKIRARPLRQSTLARINEAFPTFHNAEEQQSPDKGSQDSIKDSDSDAQKNEKGTNDISYPKKLYYTFIGNEIISTITLYDPKRSRVFRSAMLFSKYLILFFMAYISQSNQTNYGVAALGLLAAIAGKGTLQVLLSQFELCLRKEGLLSLVFVMGLSGTDIYFWFIPKIQALSHNLDMRWSFTYILLFTSDFLIIQSLISLTSYIVTIRSKFVDNQKLSNRLLNIFFKQPALLQKAN
ncbi:hypothetical protein ABPG72_017049 [Tetrahymena utriculariae]